jgi:proline racemase
VLEIDAVDYHTGGEPFRIVTGQELRGDTILAKRRDAAARLDHLRKLLVNEPRGHADMYGCFVTAPDDDGADLGVVFFHNAGYSTACGHGTIALARWAVDTGRAPPGAELAIDVPSGRVRARVHDAVTFRNVPAYVVARGVRAGEHTVDVAYGGALYACLPSPLPIAPESYARLIALGRDVKHALQGSEHARHPSDDRLSGIYGTILYEDLGDTPEGPHQRNATVFADGEVDRSPCGSGTSARAALLAADGRLGAGRVLRHDSIVGTTFRARVVEEVRAEGRPAVVTEVEGSAYRTGEHCFVLDPRDPVGTGFVLR